MNEVTKTRPEMGLRRLRQYREYKDSGVEWLGEIPAHWDVAPVYARYELALGKMLDAQRVTGNCLGPYLRNVDVQWDRVNVEDLPQMDFAMGERERYGLRPGDLLVCEGGEVGRTAIWRGELAECFYQKAIHRARPATNRDEPRYFYYVMLSASKRGVFVAEGNPNTIDHLTAVQLRHHRFSFPPLREQREIASFLDREMETLDALVTKKERLIELLQEKRATLIARAVTKGLDPNVSMKDSGVGWLDQIPAHWVVLRLKFLLRRIEQGWSPLAEQREASEDEWAVLKLGCVNEGRFDQAEHKALPAEMTPPVELEIHEGDILVSRANTRELLGSAAVVTNVRPRLLLCDKLYRLTVDLERIEPRYVVSLLATRSARHQLEVEAVGASNSMQNIKQGTIGNLVVAVPQRLEQVKILGFIEQEAGRIDGLTTKIREGIGRLKEYRTALISAAVTGKIDVRGA